MNRTIPLIAALMLMAVGASADVNLCLYNGTTTLHYQCYETELDCTDINIGLIIRECEDLSVAPGGGGGGGGGVIRDLHPELDGQGVAGPSGGYTGSVDVIVDELVEFTLIFESRDTFSPGQRMQAIARSAFGRIYYAEFDVDPADPGIGNIVRSSTPGGEPILGALDLEPTGMIATGDATVTATVIDPASKSVISVHHTPINFGDLTWHFLADGPVGNETMSWGELKSSY
jgi:hypothetical protein